MDEDLCEQIVRGTTAGIAVFDPETTEFVTVNAAFADALECTVDELESGSLSDLVATDEIAVAVERAFADGPVEVEFVLEKRDDAGRWASMDLDLISVDGEPYLFATMQSVTDSEAERTQSASRRRLEVALAGTNTGVWEWNMGTDEVIWTESMERLFGLKPGSFRGTFEAFAQRVHPEDLPDVQAAIETAVERGELFQTEYRINRDDGEMRWVHARGELRDSEDGADRMVGIVTDVTDLKEKEQTLRKREHQYNQLVERLPEAHYTLDDEWRVTYCNEAFADRVGMAVPDIEGADFWETLPQAKGSIVERMFTQVKETGDPVQFEYQYNASDHWVSIQAYPYNDGIAAISTDISDQQEALLSILDAAPLILYRFDSDGIFREVRGEILGRLGLEPSDLIGESVFEMYADHAAVIDAAERALAGESFRYTLTLGDITLETHYMPVYENGEITDVIGVSMDITAFQRQRERMEFFNSILRHDVLNGMTVIKMRAEILADELDGRHQQYAQTILDWCDTTTEVTKRVRRVIETLATPNEEHTLEPIDASAILERKVRELETAYPAVTFERTIPPDVTVRADELLADVLGNVLTNSIEHNETDGLTVETSIASQDGGVEIRIADNGQGIAEERKETVFRRGETAHAKETGSGFGLFFVDVMIEKYGGSARIEDSDAGGACFVIELDAADEALQEV